MYILENTVAFDFGGNCVYYHDKFNQDYLLSNPYFSYCSDLGLLELNDIYEAQASMRHQRFFMLKKFTVLKHRGLMWLSWFRIAFIHENRICLSTNLYAQRERTWGVSRKLEDAWETSYRAYIVGEQGWNPPKKGWCPTDTVETWKAEPKV